MATNLAALLAAEPSSYMTGNAPMDESSKRRRRLAEALIMQGMDMSPVQHPTQGLARVANALVGGLEIGREDRRDRDRERRTAETLASLPGLDAPAMPAAAMPPAAPAATPPVPAAPSGQDRLVQVLAGDNQPSPLDDAAWPQGPQPVPGAPPQSPTARIAEAFGAMQPASPEPPMTAGAPVPAGQQPRGLRNNNPLNIEAGPFAMAQPGFSGTDGRFAKFASLDQGTGAASKLLDVYHNKHGLNTVQGIVSRWAPAGDGNNVAAYVTNVAKQLGVDPNAPLAPEMRQQLIAAMAQHENGRPLPQQGAPAPTAAQPQRQAVPAIDPQSAAYIKRLLANPSTRQYGMKLYESALQRANQPQHTLTKVTLPNGDEVSAWVDPRTRQALDLSGKPIDLGNAPSGGSGPAIPAAPPGANAKEWRKTFTEKAAANAASGSLPGTSAEASAMRKELQDVPSYKNISQAAPVYKSMVEAAGRDTRAADVNLIYGLAKIMDPGSVVRESEMTVAQAVATMPQQLRATIESQLTASGRLTPEVRAQIMQEAHGRMNAYSELYNQDMEHFRGIAGRGRLNPDDVIRNFGAFEPWAPTQAAAPGNVVRWEKGPDGKPRRVQ